MINNSMIQFGDQENSIQSLKTKVDDVGAQLTKIEDADLNQKLVSNIDMIDDTIDEIRNEVKKNEQIYSKKLTDIAIKIRTDIKELKENERTLRQKLSEVIVKTQSQHPTRTKYYN